MGVFDDVIESASVRDSMYSNVTTGVVKENWNKDCPGTVRVELILGAEGKNVTGWIPVSMPYCGDGFGWYTLPEIGTEVVVAFLMGDRNCPIVIGSLWNNKNKIPPSTAGDKNLVKRFKTKGGCEVIFNDEDKKGEIQIITPGGFKVSLDDEKKSITLSDKDAKNGLVIDGDKGEVTVKAENKIHLSAGGQDLLLADGKSKAVTVKSNNVTVEASQALKLKGQNSSLEGSMMNIKAQGSFKAESSACWS